jgi:TRAP-type C4-dicarboxylate transport system substrate-binding protein
MKYPMFPTRLAFALVAGFAGLTTARPAAAQVPEPTRTQDGIPAPAPAPAPAPSRDDVKARWQKMTPQERKRVQESYARWKKLSDEDKEKLRQRHARLDEARRSTHDLLSDDERARLEKLKDDERRAELTARSKKQLRERFDRLPPDLQKGLEHELRDAPPGQRAERARRYLEKEVPERMHQALIRRVKTGELPREDVEALTKKMKGQPKLERMKLLREFALAHPETFKLSPELRKKVREHAPGDAGLRNDVRLLDQIQRHARRNPEGGKRRVETPDKNR